MKKLLIVAFLMTFFMNSTYARIFAITNKTTGVTIRIDVQGDFNLCKYVSNNYRCAEMKPAQIFQPQEQQTNIINLQMVLIKKETAKQTFSLNGQELFSFEKKDFNIAVQIEDQVNKAKKITIK